MKQTNNAEALSPVIGVILMVVITVILAAIIAAFVFGMADSQQNQKIIGIKATRDAGDNAVITLMGGDLNSFIAINYTVDGSDENTLFGADSITTGRVATITGPITGKRVIVIAYSSDNYSQIALDKQF